MAEKNYEFTENLRLSNRNTTKYLDRHDHRSSVRVCSLNFNNTTSWVKELGAIAFSTLKSCGLQN